MNARWTKKIQQLENSKKQQDWVAIFAKGFWQTLWVGNHTKRQSQTLKLTKQTWLKSGNFDSWHKRQWPI